MRTLDRRDKLMIVQFALAVLATFGADHLLTSWPIRYAGLQIRFTVDSRCTSELTHASFAQYSAEIANAEATKQRPAQATPDNGLFRWDTPNGPIWTPHADDVGGIMAGTFFRQPRWLTIDATGIVTLRAGDVVMDAGAHLGESTRYALQLGASTVIAVEPAHANLLAMRRNLAAEIADERVVIIEEGVYDREGVLSFSPHDSWSGMFHEKDDPYATANDEQLPITTIDLIVERLRLTRLDFIKMDIEGSEPYALAGARETLKRFKPRLAVGTYHRPGDLEAIPRIVLEANPSYQVVASRCRVKDGTVTPHLLYFY